jgi:class 3 adenylate cyclase/streptogramin lyase
MRSILLSALALASFTAQAQRYFFENISNQQGLPAVKVYCAAQSPDGIIWVGTESGLASYDGISVVDHGTADGTAEGGVFSLLVDREGSIWAGHLDGGITWSNGRLFRACKLGEGVNSAITSWVQEKSGSILVATMGAGLWRVQGAPAENATLNAQRIGADMGVKEHILAMAELPDGRIALVTGGVDMQVLDGATLSDFNMPGVPDIFNRTALFVDSRKRIWVGTEGGGLLRYDPRSGRSQEATEVSGSLADLRVTALEAGQPGEMWVGSVNGLWRYLPGSGTVPTPYGEEDGLAGKHVIALFRDRNGAIWVGSKSNGITRIDNGKARRIDVGRSFSASCFTQDSEGRIWVGTEGQGIVVLKDGKEAQRFTTDQGLLSNVIKALATDDHGHVWIGTTKGLNKWRHKQEGFIAFTERAGFTGIEVKPNAVCALSDGGILFGTVNGATRVGNKREVERNVPPLVTIRGWTVNLDDRPLAADASLGHDERSIRIRYGCVALSDPNAVRYMYMLDGLEDDWQPITPSTVAAYPALPPGSYTFKVKAMDRSGLWSEPPSEIAFTIHPPWYRSWWFYTALAVFVGMSLFSYIKVRERQLRLRNLVLEQKVEERTAEVVAQSKEIEGQKGRIEDLLLNILPKEISDELKEKGKATARRHEQVTVVFTDMKGFTRVAEKMTPEELVGELDDCFIHFDDIIARYGIEKIKTIGDSYMCAAGVPTQDPWHAHKCVLAALEVRELMVRWQKDHKAMGKEPWALRIGVNTGPVVAGVVGKRKFAYDIWGDTVNTASRMESSGEVGEVNISGATYRLVKDHFECVHRGQVEAKNKGAIDMYFVTRIKPEWSADKEGTKANERLMSLCGVMEPA